MKPLVVKARGHKYKSQIHLYKLGVTITPWIRARDPGISLPASVLAQQASIRELPSDEQGRG